MARISTVARWSICLAVGVACSPAPQPTPEAKNEQSASEQVGAQVDGVAPQQPVANRGEQPKPAVPFVSDDIPAALEQARSQQKALFVDAWAPWCHTCLSMHHYVFPAPMLAPLGERVVFAAVDTDRPENSEFVATHRMSMWPTMFVLDPEDGTVVGLWPGAASAAEVRDFIEQSLEVLDARRAKSLPDGSPLAALVAARTALAAGDPTAAAGHYQKAAMAEAATPNQRSEALVGQLAALYRAKRYKDCVQIGREHLDAVVGVARPVDFARTVASCVEKVQGLKQQKEVRGLVIARLQALVDEPHPDASIDDRADALEGLANVLMREGRRSEAQKVHEQRIGLLEQAAAKAPTPEVAATFDYGRVVSYLALQREDDAVAMLTARIAQFPDNYEPHARLASVLHKQKSWGEALKAVERALELSYGPRRLKYLRLKASIQEGMGDQKGQLATLEQEVHGWKKLVVGEANRAAYEAARKRFEAAVVKARREPTVGTSNR